VRARRSAMRRATNDDDDDGGGGGGMDRASARAHLASLLSTMVRRALR